MFTIPFIYVQNVLHILLLLKYLRLTYFKRIPLTIYKIFSLKILNSQIHLRFKCDRYLNIVVFLISKKITIKLSIILFTFGII